MATRRAPGVIRDAIIAAFDEKKKGATLTVAEIHESVTSRLGEDVPRSSVRSYLGLNTPGRFISTDRGQYRLARR